MRISKGTKAALSAVVLLTLSVTAVFAQMGRPDREAIGNLERLELSESEIQEMNDLMEDWAVSKRAPMAELEILRAQISRELIADDPDLGDIEELLREGLEYELELRMADIQREIGIREILGERRWALMKQMSRQMHQRGFDEFGAQLRSNRPELVPTLRLMQRMHQ